MRATGYDEGRETSPRHDSVGVVAGPVFGNPRAVRPQLRRGRESVERIMKHQRATRPAATSTGRVRRLVGGGSGLVLLVALLAGCTVLPDKPTGTPSRAFTDTANTTLGKLAAT